jgi:Ca2+-binding RTX toxin-like protein
LTGGAAAALQAALGTATAGYSTVDTTTNIHATPVAGAYNLFSVDRGYFKAPAGTNAVIATGTGNDQIIGSSTTNLLVGNNGNDGFVISSTAPGTVIAGNGNNGINLGPGAQVNITMGTGNNKVTMGGGASATITGGSKAIVQLAGDGGNTVTGTTALSIRVQSSSNVLNLAGGSNVEIGLASSDTINMGQSVGSTVEAYSGGHDNLTITGDSLDLIKVFSNYDTINATGSESISVAASDAVINLTGSPSQTNVVTASGANNTVNLSGGGADTLSGALHINVTDNATYSLTLSGNDTISFGTGNDTIVTHGTATVMSGASGVVYKAGVGADTVTAGSGPSTLIGGTGSYGSSLFVGGSGPVSFIGATVGSVTMIGGTGANTFVGGVHDTMTGGGTSDLFTFNQSVGNQSHTINDFVAGNDTISLVGYGSTIPSSDITYVGANTVIALDHGHTKITVVGYHVTSSDIVTH